jgi:hypothetical protein
LESDLLRFWQLDLHRDLGTDRLSYRRLTVLIEHLPRDSATLQKLLGHEYVSWGPTEHLLAVVVDVLQGANWQRSGGKGSKPKPLPRPKSKVQVEEHNRKHADQQERLRALRERRKKVTDGEV